MASKKDIKKIDDIIKNWKDETKAIGKTVQDLVIKGPKYKPVKTESDLLEALRRMKVTPGEAYRKLASMTTGRGEGSVRFNWKMMRLTMYVWERATENRGGYMKPKIDTVKKTCAEKRYRELYDGYYPDIPFDYDNEVKLLNKLIAEKSTKPYFVEGFYYYHKSKTIMPQKYLDLILYNKN